MKGEKSNNKRVFSCFLGLVWGLVLYTPLFAFLSLFGFSPTISRLVLFGFVYGLIVDNFLGYYFKSMKVVEE